MSLLTGTQRYAGGALFSLATHHAQAHDHEQEAHEQEAHHEGTSVCECPHLWVHPDSGLLRPVFTFLRIDSAAWPALEQTAASAHPVGPFIRLLSEDSDDTDAHSSSLLDQQLALSQAIDNMESAMQHTALSSHSQQKHREYVHQCRQKYETPLPQSHSPNLHILQGTHTPPLLPLQESTSTVIHEEVTVLRYERKVSLLYQLLSACLSDLDENNDNYHRRRKGYDARHRAALRLLATWLDIKWTKMEAIETMVACSAMAFVKEQELKKEEHSKENKWAKWKRGGIIGAAAITGGTLLAITGGLAAPAIAAGLSALAPTLGTLVPIIGSGFAAAASAAGTVAGSVAVAASFGGIYLAACVLICRNILRLLESWLNMA